MNASTELVTLPRFAGSDARTPVSGRQTTSDSGYGMRRGRNWLCAMPAPAARAPLSHPQVSYPAIVALCLLPAAIAAPVHADSPPSSAPALSLEPATAPAEPSPFPTGDWGGVRTKIADHGLAFGGFVQVDVSKNFTGGIDTGTTPVRYLLDVNLTLDIQKACGVPGGTFFFDVESHDGANGSASSVGDIQGFDTIDAVHFVQIYQMWYQQRLLDGRLRIKIGKIDANADFSVVEHGKEFLNSSMSYSTTVFPFVTYPDPAPGLEVFYEPAPLFYAGAGVYYSNSHQTFLDLVGHPESIERTPGGIFAIGEMGSRWTLPNSLPGHAAVGMWGHSGAFADLGPSNPSGTDETNGTCGFYTYLDQSVIHEDGANQSSRDLGVFVQYGWSQPEVSLIAQHVGGGVSATGLISSRPRDVLGIGPTWVHLGDQPTVHPDEVALDTFYKLQILPFAIVKPDLQYIWHPSGIYASALVFTLRVEIDF